MNPSEAVCAAHSGACFQIQIAGFEDVDAEVVLYGAPSVLPDTSPTWGEIGSFGAGSPLATTKIGEGSGDSQSPPPVGEVSGRTEGGAVENGSGPFALRNVRQYG